MENLDNLMFMSHPVKIEKVEYWKLEVYDMVIHMNALPNEIKKEFIKRLFNYPVENLVAKPEDNVL
jgi:hypothetical protein